MLVEFVHGQLEATLLGVYLELLKVRIDRLNANGIDDGSRVLPSEETYIVLVVDHPDHLCWPMLVTFLLRKDKFMARVARPGEPVQLGFLVAVAKAITALAYFVQIVRTVRYKVHGSAVLKGTRSMKYANIVRNVLYLGAELFERFVLCVFDFLRNRIDVDIRKSQQHFLAQAQVFQSFR